MNHTKRSLWTSLLYNTSTARYFAENVRYGWELNVLNSFCFSSWERTEKSRSFSYSKREICRSISLSQRSPTRPSDSVISKCLVCVVFVLCVYTIELLNWHVNFSSEQERIKQHDVGAWPAKWKPSVLDSCSQDDHSSKRLRLDTVIWSLLKLIWMFCVCTSLLGSQLANWMRLLCLLLLSFCIWRQQPGHVNLTVETCQKWFWETNTKEPLTERTQPSCARLCRAELRSLDQTVHIIYGWARVSHFGTFCTPNTRVQVIQQPWKCDFRNGVEGYSRDKWTNNNLVEIWTACARVFGVFMYCAMICTK